MKVITTLSLCFFSLILSAQIVTIPDANFKAALLANANINTNNDGEIQSSEAANYTGTINVSSKSISDLTGIEAFVKITDLRCYKNQLSSLDLSKNTLLTELHCQRNQLISLDVSKNIELRILNCSFNQLTSLDVSKNVEFTHLGCSDNQLTSLDISKNIELTHLYCNDNQLTSLDVSKNIKLEELYCSKNKLTFLDVSKNKELTIFYCTDNQLPRLDVSKNIELEYLYCSNNQLTALNVANGNNDASSPRLGVVDARNNNELSCIEHDVGFDPTTNAGWKKDASAEWNTSCMACASIVNIPDANFKAALLANPSINTDGDGEICTSEATDYAGIINVSEKNINDLTGIEAFVKITELWCYTNQLTRLDISKNIKLRRLYCYENQLTRLDVNKNVGLVELSCFSNQLSSLNLSENNELMVLNCSKNQLTGLDVSKNTLLNILYCFDNQLTVLDVSKNIKLVEFVCVNNQLTRLNVANGNNGNSISELFYVDAKDNSNLSCIQHDTGFDPTTNTNWKKDNTANWSTDCGLVGIDYFEEGELSVNLYPNPVGTVLQVESKAKVDEVELYTLLGEAITKTRDLSIDVSFLVPGIYLAKIKLKDNAGVLTKRFVKK